MNKSVFFVISVLVTSLFYSFSAFAQKLVETKETSSDGEIITEASTVVSTPTILTLESSDAVRYDIRISQELITDLNWELLPPLVETNQVWRFYDVTYQGGVRSYETLTNVSPVPGSALPPHVTMSWGKVNGATEYQVYIGTTPGGFDLFNRNVGAQTYATIDGVPQDLPSVYLRIWYKAGDWFFEDYLYTTGGQITPLDSIAAILPIPGSGISRGTVLSWSIVPGVTKYQIYVGTTVGGYDLVNKMLGSSTTYTLPNVFSVKQEVYVRIWCFLAEFNRWFSKDYTYQALGPAAIEPSITTVIPADGWIIPSTTMFSWNPVIGASEYHAYLGTGLGESDIFNAQLRANTSVSIRKIPQNGLDLYLRIWHFGYVFIKGVEEFEVEGLEAGKTYHVGVKYFNNELNSWEWYSNYSITIPGEPPVEDPPEDPPPVVTDPIVNLLWDPSPSSGVTGYRVHYGEASGVYTSVVDVGATTTATITGLISGKTYFFAVTAYDHIGIESEPSNEIATQPK